MIRINLLGVPKPKRGKRGGVAMPAGGGEGTSPVMIMVIIAALGVAANGYWYYHLTGERDRIAKEMHDADIENRRLAQVKAKFDEATREKDRYDTRVKVIRDLQSKQSGPVDLLTAVSNTVNNTDAVWLNTMKEEGNNITIDGTALSAKAVANLIGNLKKSGYFKNVEIKETYQDDGVKDMTAFQFSLVCERQEKKSS